MSDEDKKTKDGGPGEPVEGNGAESPVQPSGTAAAGELVETPDTRISALETERDELRDRMLRIAADFENYKKRVRREQLDAVARAREDVIRDLLEVIDNLERAIAAGEQSDQGAVLKGVNLVLRQFQSKLERYEVKPFQSTGQPFDPRRHEAINQVPTTEAAPGTVVIEHQKGYLVGEKLLRPAVVGVASAPKEEPKDGDPTSGGGSPADGEPGAT